MSLPHRLLVLIGNKTASFVFLNVVFTSSVMNREMDRLRILCFFLPAWLGDYVTRSSAVAEMPHDALCPSVVSLNKIVTCAEYFIIVTEASDLPLHNVVFSVTLRLLVIHFVIVSRHQQTLPLTSD